MHGRIVHLHLKPREGQARGLPKRAVSQLTITPEGVEGDYNRWRTEEATLPYVGVERGPEFLQIMLGRRGWFARVLHGGTVRTNTPIEVTVPDCQRMTTAAQRF